jgi:hypothetical protein
MLKRKNTLNPLACSITNKKRRVIGLVRKDAFWSSAEGNALSELDFLSPTYPPQSPINGDFEGK